MKLMSTTIIISPDRGQPFKMMCDKSGVALVIVLGQRRENILHPIHYAKNVARKNYNMSEHVLLIVVFAFEKFRFYLLDTKVIVHAGQFAFRYLMAKNDAKPRLIRWVLLLQEFDFEVKDRKGTKNQGVYHLSRLEEETSLMLGYGSKINDAFHVEKVLVASYHLITLFIDFAYYLTCDF